MKTNSSPSDFVIKEKSSYSHPLRRMKWIIIQRSFVVILILLQFLLWILLLQEGAIVNRGLYPVLTAISIILSLFIISRQEPGAYKMLWVVLLLTMPIPGIVFYLLLNVQGSTALYRRYERTMGKGNDAYLQLTRHMDDFTPGNTNDERLFSYLEKEGYPAYTHTSGRFFSCGEEKFPALLQALKKAKHYIFLEYFIIDEGEMWDAILEILRQKVKEGVEVRILMDDIGCFLLRPRHFAKALEKEGLRVRVFNRFTPFITAAQNYRDHRKIVAIDGRIAFTGGINLADEYINRRQRFGYWKDTAVMIEGEAAFGFSMLFLRMWDLACRKREDFSCYLPEKQDLPPSDGAVVPYGASPTSEPLVKNLYLKMISSAKEYLYITTPYLILDDSLSDALCLAAKSGVDVRIITPKKADKKLVNLVTKSYYAPLMQAGVRIYEYTPGFIHSKVVLADGEMASVGSANLDYRSLYLSFECGAFFYGGSMPKTIQQDFLKTFAESEEITDQDLKGRFFQQLLCRVLKIFEPLM